MFVYWVFLLFLFGLIIGSFLNVVVHRMVYGESPFEGRSRCPHCKKTISWKHNIPLLSFFVLKGHCAYCKKVISWQYPVVELLTGLLFVWWYVVGWGFFLLANTPFEFIQPIFWLGVGILLLLVFVFDAWYGVIPNGVNLLLLVWVFLYRFSLSWAGIMQSADLVMGMMTGVMLTVFFYGLYLVTKRKGFGLGDVKLAPSLGLLLGVKGTLVGGFFAFVIGAIFGLILMALGKKRFGQTLPFGPFLVIGTLISLLWSGEIWGWYMNMLR